MRNIVLLSFLFICSNHVYGQKKDKNKTPNVIFIYVDDLGYGDLSCYGAQEISTPHTDELAKNGIRFTRGHSTSATCTPSRFALMTGEYPWKQTGRNILPGDAPLIVPTDRLTLPKVFKHAGYETGIVGKWHLGLGDKISKDWNADIKPGPNEVGFDYSFIFPATADRVPTVFMENHRIIGLDANDPISVDYRNKVGQDPTGKEHPELLKLQSSVGHNHTIVNGIGRIGYMSGGKQTRWTDEELASTFLTKAQDFINHNKNNPFFLYFALNDIHVPRMPATIFKGKSKLGYRGDAILEMDWVVGKITEQLKELGLDQNTMIVFSSDNGPVLDDGYADRAVELNGQHKPAGVLRGWKTDIYEGGTRVPFIISWPSVIKPGISHALVSQMDFVASFAKFFHQSIPNGEATDSEDILDTFLGKSAKGRSILIQEGYHNLAIVKDNWKYIPPNKEQSAQLFDLNNDLSESINLINKNQKKVDELAHLLKDLQSKTLN
ncbi:MULTISPECIES: arylsulfatase [unclassified Sphingobacterium]|uniref:sulfatase family protein n=1 Tax=unclassified Sphingobacterium TaxID=2609468 RepID=UPI0010523E50|nr:MULTISPECIES: arylsulfatase [unclassified Sphingobacterium]MCS3556546.1 arylsulfatase A-like enzyme [Sphingobacterium sp. JUb21]TCQ99842.1 arylsulfatase A-like enzyme [Sphingobacterium sp. JUb20]